ncbi:hypothetical protein EMIT0P74_90042 [Pseudomonas sp. IT-P74]
MSPLKKTTDCLVMTHLRLRLEVHTLDGLTSGLCYGRKPLAKFPLRFSERPSYDNQGSQYYWPRLVSLFVATAGIVGIVRSRIRWISGCSAILICRRMSICSAWSAISSNLPCLICLGSSVIVRITTLRAGSK